MRNNQPCSQIEHKMKSNDVLVSRTDLKGRILYANKVFCDIAGFSEDELKGKSHNIVRHPDMPPAAFQDLWDTLTAQQPWTGFVKNRCKNGDYYWVLANVSSEYDSSGKVVSYLSVRTAPTQDQINFAEELYQQVNAGKATLPSTLKCSWMKKLKLKTVMLLSIATTLVTVLSLGFLLLSSLTEEKEATDLRVASLPLIGSVRQVLEFLPQHRGMANAYLNGKRDLASKLADNERKVDTALKLLIEISHQKQFTSIATDLSAIQREWSKVKSQWKHASAKESFRLHTDVINNLMSISSQVFHMWRLTTDNALEIAHLGEFMSEKLLVLNEHMGRLRGFGSGIAAKGSVTENERDTLLRLHVLIKQERSMLLAELDQVIRAYNPTLRKSLSADMQKLEAATEAYLKLVDSEMLVADTVTVDSGQYFAVASKALSASMGLYDVMERDLTKLLHEESELVDQKYYVSILLIVFGVLASLLLSLLMIKKTFKPMKEIVDGMQRIVEGNYSTMPIKYAFDELGEITDDMKTMQSVMQMEIFEGKNMAVQREQEQRQVAEDKSKSDAALADAFEENVGSLISALAVEVDQVSSAAIEVDTISHELAAQSESAMHGVDLGSSHVNSTAAAIEEMSVTITDVSRQVSDTQSVSAQAVIEAEAATLMMEKLTRVANEVGSIVGTISEIAEQTNLLALNASIEAARAGDAGRGFSVVAGEVKELANQTSRATSQIREQVEGIQSESGRATVAINKISKTISDINTFTTTVSEAMQQQAEAGHEISNAAQQADMSMGDARSAVDNLASSAVAVDKSSDEMIEVANSMAERTAAVQQGVNAFVETLRKG